MKTEMLTKEQIEELNYGIERYASIEDYMKQTYPDCDNETKKECELDFEEKMNSGFIEDITCGTYNGASDTFNPWEFTPRNLVRMIEVEYNEGGHEDTLQLFCDEGEENIENFNLYDKLRFMIDMYDFMIIGNKFYANLD